MGRGPTLTTRVNKLEKENEEIKDVLRIVWGKIIGRSYSVSKWSWAKLLKRTINSLIDNSKYDSNVSSDDDLNAEDDIKTLMQNVRSLQNSVQRLENKPLHDDSFSETAQAGTSNVNAKRKGSIGFSSYRSIYLDTGSPSIKPASPAKTSSSSKSARSSKKFFQSPSVIFNQSSTNAAEKHDSNNFQDCCSTPVFGSSTRRDMELQTSPIPLKRIFSRLPTESPNVTVSRSHTSIKTGESKPSTPVQLDIPKPYQQKASSMSKRLLSKPFTKSIFAKRFSSKEREADRSQGTKVLSPLRQYPSKTYNHTDKRKKHGSNLQQSSEDSNTSSRKLKFKSSKLRSDQPIRKIFRSELRRSSSETSDSLPRHKTLKLGSTTPQQKQYRKELAFVTKSNEETQSSESESRTNVAASQKLQNRYSKGGIRVMNRERTVENAESCRRHLCWEEGEAKHLEDPLIPSSNVGSRRSSGEMLEGVELQTRALNNEQRHSNSNELEVTNQKRKLEESTYLSPKKFFEKMIEMKSSEEKCSNGEMNRRLSTSEQMDLSMNITPDNQRGRLLKNDYKESGQQKVVKDFKKFEIFKESDEQKKSEAESFRLSQKLTDKIKFRTKQQNRRCSSEEQDESNGKMNRRQSRLSSGEEQGKSSGKMKRKQSRRSSSEEQDESNGKMNRRQSRQSSSEDQDELSVTINRRQSASELMDLSMNITRDNQRRGIFKNEHKESEQQKSMEDFKKIEIFKELAEQKQLEAESFRLIKELTDTIKYQESLFHSRNRQNRRSSCEEQDESDLETNSVINTEQHRKRSSSEEFKSISSNDYDESLESTPKKQDTLKAIEPSNLRHCVNDDEYDNSLESTPKETETAKHEVLEPDNEELCISSDEYDKSLELTPKKRVTLKFKVIEPSNQRQSDSETQVSESEDLPNLAEMLVHNVADGSKNNA